MLVYMTQAIDSLYKKTVQFRPDIEDLDDLVINMQVKNDAPFTIKTELQAS